MAQRLNRAAAGVSDHNGSLATLTFDVPPSGTIWTGTVSIPNAELFCQWTMTNSGSVIASWQGSTPVGPIQVADRETLQITGTSLSPDKQYVARLFGSSDEEGTVAYVAPNPIQAVNLAVPGALYYANTGAAGSNPFSNWTSPVLYVGNLQTLLLRFKAFTHTGNWLVQLQWSDDLITARNQTGPIESFNLDGTEVTEQQEFFAVKGIYLIVYLQHSTNGAIQFSVDLTGIQDVQPGMPTLRGVQIIKANTPAAIAAGATSIYDLVGFSDNNVWSSGNGRLMVVSTVKTWVAKLQMLVPGTALTYVDVDGIDSLGNALVGAVPVFVPRSTGRIAVTNNGAAPGNFTVSLVGQ